MGIGDSTAENLIEAIGGRLILGVSGVFLVAV